MPTLTVQPKGVRLCRRDVPAPHALLALDVCARAGHFTARSGIMRTRGMARRDAMVLHSGVGGSSACGGFFGFRGFLSDRKGSFRLSPAPEHV